MMKWVRRKWHLSRYKMIKEMLPDSKILLDIGCGKPCPSMSNGSFIKYIGYGTGLDKKECSDFPFIKADLTENLNLNKRFDVIVCMETLEHIIPSKLEKCLINIRNLLNKNGMFIMTTPLNNRLWKLIWWCWERSFGGMWKHDHKIHWNKDDWIKFLEKYFNILSVKTQLYNTELVVKMTIKEQDNKTDMT